MAKLKSIPNPNRQLIFDIDISAIQKKVISTISLLVDISKPQAASIYRHRYIGNSKWRRYFDISAIQVSIFYIFIFFNGSQQLHTLKFLLFLTHKLARLIQRD